MKKEKIDMTESVYDSRDIIARIEELESIVLPVYNPETDKDELDTNYTDEERAELKKEYDLLKEVEEKFSSSPDWEYGESLISEWEFLDYIKELIRDFYTMPKELESGEWPWRCFDIEEGYSKAAEEAKVDYNQQTLSNGETYLIRA